MKKLIETILKDAMHQDATDVHLTSEGKKAHVKIRCLGKMQLLEVIDIEVYRRAINYLKFIADLDINEHRVPQSGRTTILIDEEVVNLRISTLPVSLMDEIIVIRILNLMEDRASDQLFSTTSEYDFFHDYINRQQGLVLFTGPTGSGKSTLMYRLIREVAARGERQIISIEDPIEYEQEGIVQVEINEKAQIDYEPLLKGVLRCDPDVIMFGEIRDANIASNLLRASLSGHLVFSTFHSKSAVAALSRLKDFGLYDEEMVQSISLIINQRLIHTQKGSYIIYEALENTGIQEFLKTGSVVYGTLHDRLTLMLDEGGLNADEFTFYEDKFK